MTSDGSRSGVNWMRLHVPLIEWAIALASDVLPVPGTSSSEQVALAEHAHERQGDLVALALDHLLDVVEQGVEPVAEPLGLLVGRWGHGGVS